MVIFLRSTFQVINLLLIVLYQIKDISCSKWKKTVEILINYALSTS